ncbi:electron transporter RnfB [Salinisphaera shabanensis T35B1]|jgi:electron transport complex protein RnfB|uniref:Electron transport complex protein RnfB n=1 Tax=Salinisphaera shabanensis E1L3A TaxID=1033802 RepID=U2ENS0_9GAMM|nr:RnfABCDGE type electron transport complex subunit B [Salinisphaera shabanensis]ERJ19772.1 Electron transport complex protein RnfB [Salinisphaera shabanensis E1L3A]
MTMAYIDDIDALLPQTQCRRCGYDGCRPYAEAIAAGETDINRCPPGGDETVVRLAGLTGKSIKPIDPECGDASVAKVAFIREDECIGCTRCIQVCPTDAIIGAAKQMHTVIEFDCTGCELCVPACPVDCIDMPESDAESGQPVWPPERDIDADRAARARQLFEARQKRLNRQTSRRRRTTRHEATVDAREDAVATSDAKKSTIADAIARAKARRAGRE